MKTVYVQSTSQENGCGPPKATLGAGIGNWLAWQSGGIHYMLKHCSIALRGKHPVNTGDQCNEMWYLKPGHQIVQRKEG